MAKDEVKLGEEDFDDYEVMPIGPIRKLEKRVDQLQEESQTGGGSTRNDELVRDVIDIMKSNQKIVNDMTESTNELKNSVEDLTHKMDDVVTNMNEFMDLLKEASEVDMEGEIVSDMHTRIADAVGDEMRDVADEINQTNMEVVNNLQGIQDNLRRIYAGQGQQPAVSSQRSQRSQSSQGQQQQSQSRQSGGQSGSQMTSDQNERLEKLREKFDSGQNE